MLDNEGSARLGHISPTTRAGELKTLHLGVASNLQQLFRHQITWALTGRASGCAPGQAKEKTPTRVG